VLLPWGGRDHSQPRDFKRQGSGPVWAPVTVAPTSVLPLETTMASEPSATWSCTGDRALCVP
jgi:hypothetical protein